MFGIKKKKNVTSDMQADNMYKIEMLNSTDVKSIKNFDLFFTKLLESVKKGQTLNMLQVVNLMTEDGYDIDKALEDLNYRQELRNGIVGENDVEDIKLLFASKKERYKVIKIEIDYYAKMLKETNNRPYSEDDFRKKNDELKEIEEWLVENSWVANHQMQ